MIKNELYVTFTFIVLRIFGIHSCQREESDDKQLITNQFFTFNNQLGIVIDVISYLKDKNDSEQFINSFVEKFGYPKWNHLIDVYEPNRTLLFVPVHHDQIEEIETIWVFIISEGNIHYFPVSKANVIENDKWTFDYFTQKTLKKYPKSKLRFDLQVSNNIQTREWTEVTKCKPTFAGVEYNGNLIEIFTVWHCWQDIIFIDKQKECDFIEPDYPGAGGGPWNGESGGGNDDSSNPEPIVIIDDPSFVGTKAECVYKKLRTLSGGFNNRMKEFDPEFPVSHLKFTVKDESNYIYNALTFPPESYVIEIQINKKGLNRPNLSIARTIIHKVIHVEMFRKLLSIANNNGSFNQNILIAQLISGDFPGLLDYYTRYADPKKHYQHQQMAEHYRNTMINMFKEFDPSQPFEIYEALSWVGLYDTVSWNKKSKEYKDRMKKINSNFGQKGAEPCP